MKKFDIANPVPLGQDKTIQLFLRLTAQNKLGHAYIIEGDEGMGKKTLARHILKIIMCGTHSACGVCNACRTVESGTHPDIIYISNGDRQSIGIDQIRAVRDRVFERPLTAQKKAVVIQNAHLLTTQSQNALLKMIEEPPEYIVFILLCNNASKMLQTVMSRVTLIRVNPLKGEQLKQIVPDAPEFMYSYAMGNAGKLSALKDDEHFAEIRQNALDALMTLTDKNPYAIYKATELFGKDRARNRQLTDIMTLFLRDALFMNLRLGDLIANKDKYSEIEAFCKTFSAKQCQMLAETVMNAQMELGKSGNTAIAVQTMFMKCREVNK